MAIGISGIDLYIPRFVMDGSHWKSGLGSGGKFSRSVASYDEDVNTLAVSAAERLVEGSQPEALWLASVSAPYLEKSNASIVSAALDLPDGLRACEIGGTLRAGTQGLIAGWEAISAGSIRSALVTSADLRLAQPGSALESKIGDASVAVMLTDDPIAEILAIHTHTREFLDRWRRDTDRFLHQGEAKFVTDYGWIPDLKKALEAVLDKTGSTLDQITTVVFNAPDTRTRAGLAKALGLGASQRVASPPRDVIGETGCSDALIELAVALEGAQPGQKILLLNYAEGADAILLGITPAIEKRRPQVSAKVDASARAPLPSYGHYLKFRNLIDQDEIAPFSSLPLTHRQEKQILRLIAVKCRECGMIYYPVRRICTKCRAKDKMDDHRLDKHGTVFTFTVDHLYPSPLAPTTMASADLDGGGRFFAQLADLNPAQEKIAIGDRVRLVFRRYHEGENFHNYYWKFIKD